MIKKYCIWLDSEIIAQFRNFVMQKHETTYKVTQKEFENALVSYMQSHTHTGKMADQKTTTKNNQFLRLLTILCSYETEKLHSKVIRDTIIQNFGADERTIQKYVKRLLDMNYLSKEFIPSKDIGAIGVDIWNGMYLFNLASAKEKLKVIL